MDTWAARSPCLTGAKKIIGTFRWADARLPPMLQAVQNGTKMLATRARRGPSGADFPAKAALSLSAISNRLSGRYGFGGAGVGVTITCNSCWTTFVTSTFCSTILVTSTAWGVAAGPQEPSTKASTSSRQTDVKSLPAFISYSSLHLHCSTLFEPRSLPLGVVAAVVFFGQRT